MFSSDAVEASLNDKSGAAALFFFWLLFFVVGLEAKDPGAAKEFFRRPVDIVEGFLARKSIVRRCDFPVLDGKELTLESFSSQRLDGRPILITGLFNDTFLDPSAWKEKDFVQQYAGHRVTVNTARYDLESGEISSYTTVLEYFKKARRTKRNLLANAYNHALEQMFFNSNSKLPSILEEFVLRPVVQLSAAKASGTHLHYHVEAWLALLQGSKAWFIPSSEPSPAVRQEATRHTSHPCAWLRESVPKGLGMCVQQAGEVIYFGAGLPHATCNLEDFVLGIGSQGRLPGSWPRFLHALHRGDLMQIQHLVSNGPGTIDLVGPVSRLDAEFLAYPLNYTALTPLIYAAGKEYLNVAAYLIDQRASLERGASSGGPLSMAVSHGHLAMAQLLIERRASINAADIYGWCPLHAAIINGATYLVKYLLRQRADASMVGDFGITPLHYAGQHGHKTSIKLLIAARADSAVAASDGYCPIHHAAAKGHVEAVKAFLRKGIKADANPTERKDVLTPLHLAAKGGHLEMADILVSHGAETHAVHFDAGTAFDMAVGRQHAHVAEYLAPLTHFEH